MLQMIEEIFNTIDLEQALYIDRRYVEQLSKDRLMQTVRGWYKDFIFSDFYIKTGVNVDFLFLRSMVRNDYKELFEDIAGCCDSSKLLISDYKKPGRSELNLEAQSFLLSCMPFYKKFTISSGYVRMCLFLKLCQYLFILSKITLNRFRCIVFHADMQPVENLISQYCRKAIGVITATMQHGLYVDYTGFDTVNIVNYKHQTSEYFLSWGPHTSQLIERYHQDTKIVKCGKTLIYNACSLNNLNKEKYLFIILDQKIFNTQNEEMISIACKYAIKHNISVRVRFHPSLDRNKLLNKYPILIEQSSFTESLFVIGHTSSLLYEALALGCRVCRYRTNIPAITLPEYAEFTTVSELEFCLQHTQPAGISNNYFYAIGQHASNNYRLFFSSLF